MQEEAGSVLTCITPEFALKDQTKENSAFINKSQTDHKYGRRTIKTQPYLLWLHVVHLAINKYMFRPLYRPSSGCTPSYYKVVQYTTCLLLMARSHSQYFVA